MPLYSAPNFAKCRLIFRIFSLSDLAVNFWKAIIKHPTAPQMHRCTKL